MQKQLTSLPDDVFELRPLTAEELGRVVVTQREQHGWTQETLAEIARVTVRTVQRVETGKPSSVDTRRALARALDWKDIDAFNKPWPIPNQTRLKREVERIERETVPIALEKMTSGRTFELSLR